MIVALNIEVRTILLSYPPDNLTAIAKSIFNDENNDDEDEKLLIQHCEVRTPVHPASIMEKKELQSEEKDDAATHVEHAMIMNLKQPTSNDTPSNHDHKTRAQTKNDIKTPPPPSSHRRRSEKSVKVKVMTKEQQRRGSVAAAARRMRPPPRQAPKIVTSAAKAKRGNAVLVEKRKKQGGVSSEYLGVSYRKNTTSNSWEAAIKIKGVTKYLGIYRTEIGAARAYTQAAQERHMAKSNKRPRTG